jgi:hypothetical protein
MIAKGLPRTGSGISRIGGRFTNRPTVVSSSGSRSLLVSSRQACRASGPRSTGYHRIPAYACVIGNSSNSIAVTPVRIYGPEG